MKTILYYVQQIPNSPAHYHPLTAQVISAVVFILLLILLVKVFTYICNNYLARVVKFFKAERWFNTLTEKRFFTALTTAEAERWVRVLP